MSGPGTRPTVIVGGGKTGSTATATLRDEGFDGPVVLVSREPGIPFGRPPLSKTYLRSEEDLEEWYIEPGDWYAAHDVDLRTDSVVAVNPAAHTVALESGQGSVMLADGERVAYDIAVVGVGIDPDVPAVAGSSMALDNGILVDEQCRGDRDAVDLSPGAAVVSLTLWSLPCRHRPTPRLPVHHLQEVRAIEPRPDE
jgi:3-phenylpropionate/trans-cinnamate dioxygenase ferredoxin reductase subunit